MIIVNRKDDKIIQRSSEITITDMNGKYLLDEPETTKVSLANSIPTIQSDIQDSFLALYPDYTDITFKSLPVQSDFDASALYTTYPSRCQLGSDYNTCAILPKNENTNAYGVLITDTITTTSKDKFLVYWKVAIVSYGQEQSVNVNVPSTMTYEILEPSDIQVYISNDDGVSYTEANYLTPVSFSSASTTLRLAFINNSLNKIHLLGYAILY